MKKENIYSDWKEDGWKEMSTLLDQEMPQKKKRRRIVFWFIFGLGLGLSLLVYWMTSTSEEVVATPIANHEHPIITKENRHIAVTPPLPHTTSKPKKNHPSHSNTTAISTPKTTTAIFNTQKNTTSNYHHHFSNTQQIPTPSKTTINTSTMNTPVINVTPKNNAKRSTNQVKSRKIAVVETIAPVLTSEIKANKVSIRSLPIHKKKANKSAWEYYMLAGSTLQNYNGIGLTIGGGISYHWNKKWAVYTGLEYRGIWVSLDNVFKGLTNTDLANYHGGSEKNTPKNIQEYVSSVQMPILLSYHPQPRWNIKGGMVLDQHLFSTPHSNGSHLKEQNSTNSPVVSLPGSLDSNPISFSDIQPKLNVHASIGVQYYFYKKWNVNLQYEYGLRKRSLDANLPLSRPQRWTITLGKRF